MAKPPAQGGHNFPHLDFLKIIEKVVLENFSFTYGKTNYSQTNSISATPYVTRLLTQIPCQQCYTICNKAADPDTASAVLMLRQHLLADCSTTNTVLLLSG
ncbi:hypothetical protein J6590_013343 [Homalodisca vitripennis]|nr:hypothetical protein J6590_013343 [Homalodisca vitripennis]